MDRYSACRCTAPASALFAGVGLFSMGALHGQKKLHEQCSDDVFIQAIIIFPVAFVSDLAIMLH